MTYFPEFSDLLTHYLAQRDRSPVWLARRLEVHSGTVSRWLNQHTRPATPELVIRIADILGVHTPSERRALLAAAGYAYQESVAAVASSDLVAVSAALESAAVEAPKPAQTQQLRSRLPIGLTSFVGRGQELEQITERIADPAARLVTIVGLGGMGKSRLAIEAAAQVADHFADGVYFVALASVTSAALIPTALAAALEIPLQGAIDPDTYVMRYCADKQALLILDNLEHLLDGTHFIERLLERAPGVKVLATSRVRLRLAPEWLFPLDGLNVPSSANSATLEPGRYSSVELFVQRARRLIPDFSLSWLGSADVIRICQLVGGMPLAIELAAAWLRYVPLAEIAREIQSNWDFLAATTRNNSERHLSLRAVFEHSWQLLQERERHTLMVLGVFRGGFTRQAAADVASAELEIILGLVDSSWIRLNQQGRYEIHELARQYAEEKLEAELVRATDARSAHCAYYAALADRIAGPDGALSAQRKFTSLVIELDNIWSGWRWAATNRNFDEIGKYVTALAWFGDAHGLYREVVSEFEKLCAFAREKLSAATVPVASRHQITLEMARLLSNLSYLYGRAISVELGIARGAEAIELMRQLGLDGRIGELSPSYLLALVTMSIVSVFHADYQMARLLCEEILLLIQGRSEYAEFYGDALNTLGQVASLQGKYAEAESYLTQCIAQAPSNRIRNAAIDRLAYVYVDMGNLAQATRLATAALTTAEEFGNRSHLGSSLLAVVEVAMAQDHLDEVEEYLDRVAVIAEETDNRHIQVRCMSGKARLARRLGDPVEALQLYQQALELARSMARHKDTALTQIGAGFALLDQRKFEESRSCLHAALGAAWERRIMPEVLWAVVGLAALKGYAHQPQIAEQWLWCAATHPSCPQRVQIEAAEIRKGLALEDAAYASDEKHLHDPVRCLEGVVLELLQ